MVKRFDVGLRLGAAFCLLAAVLFVVGWQGVRHLRPLDREMLFLIILAGLMTVAIAVYGTVGVTREAARRRRVEEALRQSNDQLEQRIQQRTAELERTNRALQAELTERRRIELQLRMQTTALDAAANAVIITDHNGTIQSVNPAFTALTGYSALEAVGQNPRILKSGKQDEAFYRDLWQTISSGQVWSGELTNRRKDGSLYTEEMTITPVRSADGAIARYIAIKQDVSERKRAEEAVRASQQILEGIINAIPVQGILEGQESRLPGLQRHFRARCGVCRSEGCHRQR